MRYSVRQVSASAIAIVLAATGPALLGAGASQAATSSPAVAKAAPAALVWPVTRFGSSGERVFAIQYLLQARGYRIAPVGHFGPVTRADVRGFQRVRGLVATGAVGQVTWPRLIIQVRFGNRGPAVAGLQHNLRFGYGYRNLPVTGLFGRITRADVRNFQRRHHLAVDGIAGIRTWHAIIVGER